MSVFYVKLWKSMLFVPPWKVSAEQCVVDNLGQSCRLCILPWGLLSLTFESWVSCLGIDLMVTFVLFVPGYLCPSPVVGRFLLVSLPFSDPNTLHSWHVCVILRPQSAFLPSLIFLCWWCIFTQAGSELSRGCFISSVSHVFYCVLDFADYSSPKNLYENDPTEDS